MTDKYIRYQKGYKYQLVEDYIIQTEMLFPKEIYTPFIVVIPTGVIEIKTGYAWDGASGPTIDTRSSMRGSLVHDVGYQLMRDRHISIEYRKSFDALLEKLCIEDGMYKWRAKLWEKTVRKFAVGAALPENIKKIYTAPREVCY